MTNHQRAGIHLARELLVSKFPACFSDFKQPKAPLKIGIFDDILTALPEIGRLRLHGALNDYTGGPTYLGNVIEGAARIDLTGAAVGEVTADEAKHAAHRLVGILAFRESRKARSDEAAA